MNSLLPLIKAWSELLNRHKGLLMNNENILKIIQNLNQKRTVNFTLCEVTKPEYSQEYSGLVTLANYETVSLNIAFCAHFPLSLPKIYVKDNTSFRAHVGSDGKICLFDSSSVLIKQNMADQILIDCFDRAIQILNINPGSKEYNDEVCREFDSYWFSVMAKKTYSCLDVHDIQFAEYPMIISKGVSVVAATKNEAEVILKNNFGVPINEDTFDRKCIVIRIRDGSNMIPLAKSFKWSAVRRYVIENTSSSVKRAFKKFLNKNVKHIVRYLLLIYPTKEGEILFGFRLEFNNARSSKIENSSSCKVENTFCERIDYNYLLVRGGATPILKNKNVLLLGCGSIGGYIANNICQSGATNLDILDDDIFQAGNVHRHWLGFDCIHPNKIRYKSDLVKEKLENKYPYVDIDSLNFIDRKVETFLADISRLKHYDLIISALGEPTLNLEINKLLYEHSITVPFLCCFNEPYGIGGHVIVVNLDRKSCLQCLYTDLISSEIISFRGSLVAPNQNFKKNVSGCSSSFVPYSCIDSQQTAILATRKSIDILEGHLTKNMLYSWLGVADNFIDQGYILSAQYLNNTEKSFISIDTFANPNCPVCKN